MNNENKIEIEALMASIFTIPLVILFNYLLGLRYELYVYLVFFIIEIILLITYFIWKSKKDIFKRIMIFFIFAYMVVGFFAPNLSKISEFKMLICVGISLLPALAFIITDLLIRKQSLKKFNKKIKGE